MTNQPEIMQQNATPQRAGAKWEDAFLASLALHGTVTQACIDARIDRSTAYRHRDADSEFKLLWQYAIEEFGDSLVDEMKRRAVEGVLEPVFQGGQLVGNVRKYSDSLLLALAKAKLPEQFRERHDVTSDGKPMVIAITKMDVDQL